MHVGLQNRDFGIGGTGFLASCFVIASPFTAVTRSEFPYSGISAQQMVFKY